MPPMDFPANPVVGQVYNGYVWSGTAWESANPNTISLTGQVIVANQAARDAMYPTPIQGNAVWRNDLGYAETYYTLYNSSTNTGGHPNGPGWFPTTGKHSVAAFAATQGTLVDPKNIIIKTGVASGTTNSTGVLTHTLPTPFPTACIAVIPLINQSVQMDAMIVEAGQSATTLQFFFPGAASVTRKMQYVAFGY